MKIAIIGYGFVGKALKYALNDNVDVFIVDPNLETNIKDLKKFNPEFIFVCVPTPMLDNGMQDCSIVESVIDEIIEHRLESIIVIKSTILPNFLDAFSAKIKNLLCNPEFLREKHANYDFINSELTLIGGDRELSEKLKDFYTKHTKCKTKNYKFTDLISASLAKYTINTFLATKVVFFNQLYNIHLDSGASSNWEDFIKIISSDSRIGNSHMQVPGPDARFGFGGPCFPKDCNAFNTYSKDIKQSFSLLDHALLVNNAVRAKYTELTQRESEQNTNFENNKTTK